MPNNYIHGNIILLRRLQRRERYAIAVQRRVMRDTQDPFAISEERFRELYRFPKIVFERTFLKLEPLFHSSQCNTAIPAHIRFLSALHFFATGSYQRDVGQNLLASLSQSSISRCVEEVAVILNQVQSAYVTFPSGAEEATTKSEFYGAFGFPGILGLMDGSHIKIVAPKSDVGSVYYCRKGGHSINLLLICDSKYLIRYANAKFPGTSHDAYIWRCSELQNYFREKYSSGERNFWLLGDSGFPLQPWLMTPFAEPSNVAQQRYNIAHKKTRCIVERCIGVLKARFRCLSRQRCLCYTPEKSAKIINACIILHNILIKVNLPISELIEEINVASEEITATSQNSVQNLGRSTRNELVDTYFSR